MLHPWGGGTFDAPRNTPSVADVTRDVVKLILPRFTVL